MNSSLKRMNDPILTSDNSRLNHDGQSDKMLVFLVGTQR